jgi:hypothetical protein
MADITESGMAGSPGLGKQGSIGKASDPFGDVRLRVDRPVPIIPTEEAACPSSLSSSCS